MENSTRRSKPPEASDVIWRGRIRIQAPIQRFLALESAGGILLIIGAAAAMLWANLDHVGYESFWHSHIALHIAGREFDASLHFLVNEVLMGIFFLLVGAEIKREAVDGELSNLRRASLPIIAAIGGMIGPALIYAALNRGPNMNGWAIPTATDIAFAVGVLTLLGKRVPPALKILLLTLAVADDIGAIVIIALFYNSGITLIGIIVALVGIAGFIALQKSGWRPGLIYFLPLGVVWAGMLEAGIHPTLAGVCIGLLVPARPWIDKESCLTESARLLSAIGKESDTAGSIAPIMSLREVAQESLSPLARLQHALHPIVAFGIMPLFAIANAGVYLGGDTLAHITPTIGLGIGIGLVLGKPIGILLACWLAIKSGVSQFPGGISWRGILVVGLLAGIGFTMSNFTALLSFEDPMQIGTAKLAILIGSGASAIIGLIAGRALLTEKRTTTEAKTLLEAETSDSL